MRMVWPWSRGRQPVGTRLGGVDLGDRPWLVLGGGGLKGLAHLGAWRVLQEAGFRPAGILGTSIGALAAACLAGGRPVEELEAEARTLERDQVAPLQRRALWVNGIRAPALFQGDPLRATIQRLLPHGGWGAYPIPVQMNAVELGTARTEWFGTDARTDVTPAQAVYASAALPVFYPPATLPGGVYVDGGTLDALPMLRAAELGATGIVAVDVGSGGEVSGADVAAKGMLSVHQRVFSIMAARRRLDTVCDWSGPPLLYLRPRLDGYGSFDFDQIPYFLEEGGRAARELLEIPSAVL
ncbi:patatin family protein [soil metagenome]